MFRSNALNFLSLVAIVATVAVLSCLVAFYGFIRPQLPATHYPGTFVEQLQLTEAQQKTVGDIEARYEEARQQMLVDFDVATRALANLLMQEDAYTDEVAAAIDSVHHVHGELQALSVQRYFALLEALPEEKQERLRQLASEALSQPE